MNKLTKIGVSALCGSLAAISAANAGELSASGGVDMSWISMPKADTGNPIGMGSNVSFAGSGELDNGWGVALSIAYTNKAGYSSSNVTVTIPSMGDLIITQGGTGTGIDRMDDKTPSAWEEAYGFGLGSGVQTVSGGSGGAGFEFTPNFTPDGATLRIGYTPDADGGSSNDKVSAGVTGPAGSAWDLTLDLASGVHGVEGLDLFAGYADITMESANAAHQTGDKEEWTAGANYAIGGLTLGYQYSVEDVATTSADFYENSAYGVSFNINDNFTVSYNNYQSDKNIINAADVELEASSIQLAYTAGGLSVRIAEGEVDNRNYSTAATDDRDGRAISVSLAF
jgi:hypothetical protein